MVYANHFRNLVAADPRALRTGICLLGHNDEQSVHYAAVVFATSATLYALVALVYGWKQRKERP